MSSSTYDPEADRRWDADAELDGLAQVEGWPESVDIWAGWVPRFEHEDATAGPGTAVDPAVAACAQLTAGLAALAGLPVETVGNDAVLSAVDSLMAGGNRTAGLLARFVREVDSRGLYPPTWAGNPTATYLQHRYRLRPSAATRIAERARGVIGDLPALGAAMIDGAADVAQADAIRTGMDLLPDTADADVRGLVAANLVDHCDDSDPLALLHRAEALAQQLTVISDDGPPPDDGEPDSHARRSCTVRPVDGGVEARIFAPGEEGAEMLAYLRARSAPDDDGHPDPEDPNGRDTRSADQRRYDALAEAWQHAATCTQQPAPPVPGILITLDYDAITQALGGATLLDTAQRLPASVARRMCCESALIPTVLGGRSVPLDLGRGQRLFSTAQRHALTVRDGGCSFPGCDKPPVGCHAHHLTEWEAQHGPTSLDNGALLCPHHHRTVHRHGWTGHIGVNGYPEYTPPAWVDQARTPRQHHRYTLATVLRR